MGKIEKPMTKDHAVALGICFGTVWGVIIENIGLGICLGLCVALAYNNNKK